MTYHNDNNLSIKVLSWITSGNLRLSMSNRLAAYFILNPPYLNAIQNGPRYRDRDRGDTLREGSVYKVAVCIVTILRDVLGLGESHCFRPRRVQVGLRRLIPVVRVEPDEKVEVAVAFLRQELLDFATIANLGGGKRIIQSARIEVWSRPGLARGVPNGLAEKRDHVFHCDEGRFAGPVEAEDAPVPILVAGRGGFVHQLVQVDLRARCEAGGKELRRPLHLGKLRAANAAGHRVVAAFCEVSRNRAPVRRRPVLRGGEIFSHGPQSPSIFMPKSSERLW